MATFPCEKDLFYLARKYVFYERIFTGTNVVVYKARDKRRRIVAIKLVQGLNEGYEEYEWPQTEPKEVRMARQCKHKNVVEFLKFYPFPESDSYALVTRYYNNKNVENDDIKKYIKDLLSATEYLHSIGIIHRDIKPDNYIWTGKKGVLLDFDCAAYYRPINGHYSYTGTDGFIAPEVRDCDDEIDTDDDEDVEHEEYVEDECSENEEEYDENEEEEEEEDDDEADAEEEDAEEEDEPRRKKGYDYKVDSYSIGIILGMKLCKFKVAEIEDGDKDESHILEKLNTKHYKSNGAYDLVYGLLEYDPQDRLSPTEALKSKYFM